MKLLAIIPARGGSKAIPRKNIHPLAGRPLIAYTIAAAQGAGSIDRVVVSTDNDEIADICRKLGVEVRIRPAELAQDGTPTRAVLQHVVQEFAVEGYKPDAVLTLQPTSPLRTASHIDAAVAKFRSDGEADSLVSVVEVPHIFHPRSVMRRNADGFLEPYLGEPQPTRRQDKETVFARNGAAIYITRTERLSEFVFGGRLLPFPMDAASSIDIDTLDDIAEAERRLKTGERAV